jgi:SAM-dependent methyltransferase
MGYAADALDRLTDALNTQVTPEGGILELGDQRINDDLNVEIMTALHRLVTRASRTPANVQSIIERHFISGQRRIASAFEDSDFTYRCLDINDGPSIIKADLNAYMVPAEWRGKFDLVTNFGTTEHVFDQLNAFRAMHDFAKVGGLFIHDVPFAGYYNHGLFAYNPAFFIFLAHANQYAIKTLDLSRPHLPHHIQFTDSMPGTNLWRQIRLESGILTVELQKTRDQKFELFSDYHHPMPGQKPLSEPWLTLIAERYWLRLNEETG